MAQGPARFHAQEEPSLRHLVADIRKKSNMKVRRKGRSTLHYKQDCWSMAKQAFLLGFASLDAVICPAPGLLEISRPAQGQTCSASGISFGFPFVETRIEIVQSVQGI